MPRRKTGRKHGQGWHLTNRGWACTLGARGARVRIFEKRRGGGFWRAVWLSATTEVPAHWDRRPFRTTDRAEAEQFGRTLVAELVLGHRPRAHEVVRLGALWRRYSNTCPTFMVNAPHTRADANLRARCLLAFFGDERDVATLSHDDVVAYSATRVRGGLLIAGTRPDSKMTLKPAGKRSAQADLKLLVKMLRWATTVKLEGGQERWLDRNPLDGVRLPRERAPRRPVATYERFRRTMDATRRLEVGATTDVERRRWQALRCSLAVAEACGRRLNAVRLLTWADVDFTGKTVRWSASSDKAGVRWIAPLPADAAAALRQYQRHTGAIASPVFTLPGASDRVPSRHWFAWALQHAEAAAGLPNLDGGLWHPLRRKWATERMHLPLKAVATAGGWLGTETLVECYQQPDAAMLRAVIEEPRKLRDGAR